MRCPSCGVDTPEGMNFCGRCGAKLAQSCLRCGFENPPGFAFCGRCGTPLTEQPLAQQAQPLVHTPPHLAEKILTAKAALEGERKQVTVLFADLKGSMELLADRDPEEARQLLDPVLEQMMDAVHRYEGTVNQLMGDGIMALFGAPIAHEDHAVRACYAALALQAALRRDSDEVRRTLGFPVDFRVGLNAGEVVARAIGNDLHTDYSAVGQHTHRPSARRTSGCGCADLWRFRPPSRRYYAAGLPRTGCDGQAARTRHSSLTRSLPPWLDSQLPPRRRRLGSWLRRSLGSRDPNGGRRKVG
jgi:hypothetical protein